jgi:hypothetical protein
METVKNAVNYVSETVQQGVSATSKEANKEVAKDSNATLSTRYDILPINKSLMACRGPESNIS